MSASNFDCRLSVGLPQHPKTKKLLKIAGDAAGWYLVRLFLWAAQNRPDGDLKGMDADDIELAVDWPGEDGRFVDTLLRVRFLDGSEGAYKIHDWAEHNPYAAAAEDRSKSAQKAANARWNKGKKDADGMRPACDPHAKGNADSEKGNAPSLPSLPSLPSITEPLPDQDQKTCPPAADDAPEDDKYTPGFDAWFKAYPRAEAKKKAFATWVRDGLEKNADWMLRDVLRRAKEHGKWLEEGGKFIPMPTTFLNQARYRDEIVPAPTKVSKPSVSDSFADKTYTGSTENAVNW